MRRESSTYSLLILILLLIFDSVSSSCQSRCGDIEIPYPFGIGVGCYLNKWYEIQCFNNTITFLSSVSKEVVSISLPGDSDSYGSVRIKNTITSKGCSTDEEEEKAGSLLNLTGSPFYVSFSNTLVAVGCNITVSLTNIEPSMVGCSSSCNPVKPSKTTPTHDYLSFVSCETNTGLRNRECDATSIKNGTICNGIGCCQARIPDDLQQIVGVRIDENSTTSTGGCKVAFLTDDAYSFKGRADPKQIHTNLYVTVELGWFIQTTNVSFIDFLGLECRQRLEDSSIDYRDRKRCTCQYSANSSYASCGCNYGYKGNPYSSEGCKGQ